MSGWKKLASAAAATGGGLNVEDVFSTYLIYGDGATSRTITNNIDLSTEGGMVWHKRRNSSQDHYVWDTERGAGKDIRTNATDAERTSTARLSAFTTSGFTLGNDSTNESSQEYCTWTFRKAPKFFDVVTYTGNGNDSRTISHNLSSTPGFAIVKRTNSSGSWICWHRGISDGTFLTLNANSAATSHGSYPIFAGASSFSDTTVTLGGGSGNLNKTLYNNSGDTYVLYLFAHNDGDGGFGPNGDADIIKCGSYTGNGSTNGPEIDLGFEPQWILVKSSTFNGGPWYLIDTMRGFGNGVNNAYMYADASNSEFNDYELLRNTGQGFQPRQNFSVINGSGQEYIYIAIRRGPMAVPEDAADVFAIDPSHAASTSSTSWDSGFPVDMAIHREPTGAGDTFIQARLTGSTRLKTNTTGGQQSNQSSVTWDSNEGWGTFGYAGATEYSWMWKRAPNFFDVVTYTGNGTAGLAVSHNLGVAPEMIWVKARDGGFPFTVYHSGAGNTKAGFLNSSNAFATSSDYWNNTSPTDASFTVGGGEYTNYSGINNIAYLFATINGVSKVGSYTGNSSTQNIDCGFSSGARFVMIKCATASSTNWMVMDTERGIVAGNDPALYLNSTSAQNTTTDWIDPYSSGFTVNALGDVNSSGETYIYYAIA